MVSRTRCGADTAQSIMELPLVLYGDRLMWKKADASRSTRFFTILKGLKILCDTPMNENLGVEDNQHSS